MLIDWFTVIAQALNFLILVWLMKRFLYKPILNAINEREKRIAAELAEADKKKSEAQKEGDDFKRKNEEFDRQRAMLLNQVTVEAQAERQRLLVEARRAAEDLSYKRLEALKAEEHNLHQAIRRRTGKEVFSIARKTLSDLAGTGLEERMADLFINRLRKMEGQAKADLAGALRTAPEPALVRSAFDLPMEQRASIQKALNETFSSEIRVRFEAAPELINGIELTTNGQKLAWSIEDYLVSMEKGVEEILKEKDKTASKASSDLTPRIAKRAYELYEMHGRKNDSAIQDWSQAEREVRKTGIKAEPKPEAKVEPKVELKAPPKPEAKAEIKPEEEVALKPKAEVTPKPEIKNGPKTEVKAEPGPEVKVEPKPEKVSPGTKSA
jgi:F-type H+-transporting ATPase subunit b